MSEEQGNEMPGCLASQCFWLWVRQPAALMEMDGAQGGLEAVAACSPHNTTKTPNSSHFWDCSNKCATPS